MPSRSTLVGVLALLVIAAGCRASSEVRPAFTDETDAPAGELSGTIVFAGQDEGVGALFTITPGTDRPRRLSPTGQEERAPAVSPDGSRLAFAVTNGEASGIYTRGLDGSGRRAVVSGRGFYDHPSWSPDGRRLAYAFAEEEGADWDIFVVGEDGSDPQRLSTSDATDWYPSWSPAGDEIAFTSDRDGDHALWLLDPAAGTERKIVDSSGQDREPAFSPDGDTIAFSTDRVLERWQLFVYDLESGEERQLIRTNSMDRYPSWSPDGRYIVTSVGYLGMYHADGEKLTEDADRWKLTDALALTSTWAPGGGG